MRGPLRQPLAGAEKASCGRRAARRRRGGFQPKASSSSPDGCRVSRRLGPAKERAGSGWPRPRRPRCWARTRAPRARIGAGGSAEWKKAEGASVARAEDADCGARDWGREQRRGCRRRKDAPLAREGAAVSSPRQVTRVGARARVGPRCRRDGFRRRREDPRRLRGEEDSQRRCCRLQRKSFGRKARNRRGPERRERRSFPWPGECRRRQGLPDRRPWRGVRFRAGEPMSGEGTRHRRLRRRATRCGST